MVEQSAHARAGTTDAAASLLAKRVLVVDDAITNRQLLRLMLERAGATVVGVENGQEALHAIDSASFDIVLMDMQMPIMDGYTAARTLRARGWMKPIIAITGSDDMDDRIRCLEAGCSSFLSKPVQPNSLWQTVATALRAANIPDTSPPAGDAKSVAPVAPTKFAPEFTADDSEMREIAVEFVDRLKVKLAEMETAVYAADMEALAQLAHWLKGTASTVGFTGFTRPAVALESAARQAAVRDAMARVQEICNLTVQIQRDWSPSQKRNLGP